MIGRPFPRVPHSTLRLLGYSDSGIHSGAESLFGDVVAGLSRRPPFEVACAAPRRNAALVAGLGDACRCDVLDVPAQPLPLAALHLYDPRRLRRIADRLREARPDALLVNLPSAEYGASALIARQDGVPALGILHVSGSPRRLGFRLGWLRERLARRALRSLDAVCVLTDSARGDYEDLWSDGTTLVRTIRLPRPVLRRADRHEARSRLRLPPGPLVGIAGRVSFKQKGHDTFAAAAARLAAPLPDLHFAVAGTGRDVDRLAETVERLGLDDRFHLLGHVEPIADFLSAVDAIALPSRFEGLPLIALEALELGVPGVASSVDGLRDVWPAPWRVPAGDAAALAAGLERLLAAGDDSIRPLLEEGREAARRCTSEDVSADVADVLEEMTGGR